MKIAIAAYCDKVEEATRYDDKLLKLALEKLGNEVEVIDWQAKSTMDLHGYHAIVVTTTWNLHKYPKEFEQWLKNCELDGKKRLINDQSILRLGVRKESYFTSLIKDFGIVDSPQGSITPSVFITKGNIRYANKAFTEILSILIKENQKIWSKDIVIKPITSAGGEDTYRFTNNVKLLKNNSKKWEDFIDANKLFSKILHADNSNGVIIQPFINSVEIKGEYQLVFIETEYSHAITKPKGFRNIDSTCKKYINKKDLPTELLDFARRIMSSFVIRYNKNLFTRIRIDLFCGQRGPVLCEVELIEPNINLEILPKNLATTVAHKYAQAIIKQAHYFN